MINMGHKHRISADIYVSLLWFQSLEDIKKTSINYILFINSIDWLAWLSLSIYLSLSLSLSLFLSLSLSLYIYIYIYIFFRFRHNCLPLQTSGVIMEIVC